MGIFRDLVFDKLVGAPELLTPGKKPNGGVELNGSTSPTGRYVLNKNTGRLCSDISGGRNHGVIDGATWVSTREGMALSFDGINDVVDFGDNDRLQSGSVTVGMRVKLASGSSDDMLIHNGITPFGFNIYCANGVPRIELDTVSDAVANATGTTDIRGGIHDVWLTYDAATGGNALYVDGVSEASIPSISGALEYLSAENLTVGAETGGSRYSDFILYDLRLYDRFFTSLEIMEELRDLYGDLKPKNLIALPFAEAGVTGSLTASATSAGTFGAAAAASGAVTEGATAGDTPASAAAALAALTAGSTSAELHAALAAAQAAITNGTVAGETWAADSAALASILEAALAGDTWAGAVSGANAGSITEGATSQEQFLSAATTVAALTAGATSADVQAGLASAAASLTSGALAGATFAVAGEIGNLVADIIIQAAIDGAILIGKAIDGDVTIN